MIWLLEFFSGALRPLHMAPVARHHGAAVGANWPQQGDISRPECSFRPPVVTGGQKIASARIGPLPLSRPPAVISEQPAVDSPRGRPVVTDITGVRHTGLHEL